MIKIKLFFFFTFLLFLSCVQKTESPVDPSSPSGYLIQNNLCALFKICPPVAPTPGASGVLTFTSVGKTSLTLNWTAATDDLTAQSELKYQVYHSTKDNLTTLASVKANGTAVGTQTANIATLAITGLSASTTYYFNIIVEDSAGNQNIYVSNNQYMLNDKVVMFMTTSATTGNVKGSASSARTGADALCSSSRSSITIVPINITCTGIRAFLSLTGDAISSMPTTYSIDSTLPIVGPTNTKIGNNWADLLDNSIIVSLSSAGLPSVSFWTFATSAGAIGANSDETCVNGTDSTGGHGGNRGSTAQTGGTWLNNSTQACDNSGGTAYLLCVCY